jgi:peptide/nickel transport system permease protein
MARYLLRRLLLSVPLLFAVSILTFLMVAIVPGDPAVRILGAGHTAAEYQALDAKLGLSAPLLVQYWHWIDGVLHGTLGTSLFTNQSVASELAQRLPATVWLVIGATLVTVVAGVALGLASAVWRGPLGRVVDAASWLSFAVPNFWLGLILIEFIALRAHLLPSSGFVPLGQDPGAWLRSLILPVITLAAVGVTGVAKQTRDAMSEVLGREFMTALRMAGLPRRSLLLRHALRNAAIPVVTAAGLFAIAMLGGTILVEQVFVLPGMGSLVVQAAADHDLPVIEGAVLYFTVIVIAVNLLIDLSYAWLNPKVRVAA